MKPFIFFVFIFAIFVTGCAQSEEDNNFESLEESNQTHYKIGAVIDTTSEPYAVNVKISTEKDLSEIQRPTDLNEAKFIVGIVTGSSSEGFVQKILSQATLKHFSSVGDMILALEENKIDAGAYSQPSLEVALKEQPEKFKLLKEPILNTNVCMAISPKPHIENLGAHNIH